MENEQGGSQWRTIGFIVGYAASIGFLVFAGIDLNGDLKDLSIPEAFGLAYLCFLLAFWVTYFRGKHHKLGTLRIFLDKHTYRKEHKDIPDPAAVPGKEDMDSPETINARNTAVQQRALAGIISQGTFMTAVALFLGPVLGLPEDEMSSYQSLMRPVIAGLAILTVTLILWSIDLLDTAQNVFRGGSAASLEYRAYFFRQIGLHEPKGGASYRFYGFAFLSIFVISAISFFQPLLTGPGVTVFCYLGYPVLFGYRVTYEKNEETIKPDKDIKWPALSFALIGLLFSILAWRF